MRINSSFIFLKVNKIWHHDVIKCLQKKSLAPKDIHADMVAAFVDEAPGLSTVQKWAAEGGWASLEDDPGFERPATATT